MNHPDVDRSGWMRDVKTIESAVAALAPEQLAEFRRWFAEFDDALWDKQIESDAARGNLDLLAAEAHADYDNLLT
jgi:hypothetical protein